MSPAAQALAELQRQLAGSDDSDNDAAANNVAHSRQDFSCCSGAAPKIRAHTDSKNVELIESLGGAGAQV